MKMDAHCLGLMTQLEDEFGDRVTYRGNDYAKHVALGKREPIKYSGNTYIQRSAHLKYEYENVRS